MRALLALVLLLVGCDDERIPDKSTAERWRGPLPAMALHVIGPAAVDDSGKQEACRHVARTMSVTWDGRAPIQAVIYIQNDGNRLVVISQRRGVIVDERRPGWSMSDLCRDAIGAVLREYSRELGRPLRAETEPSAPAEPPPERSAREREREPDPSPEPAPRPARRASPIDFLPAPANATPEVQRLVASATAHAAADHYQEALDDLLAAKRLGGHAVLLYDIAQCHLRLDHRREALGFFKQYLSRELDPPNRQFVERTIRDLEKQAD